MTGDCNVCIFSNVIRREAAGGKGNRAACRSDIGIDDDIARAREIDCAAGGDIAITDSAVLTNYIERIARAFNQGIESIDVDIDSRGVAIKVSVTGAVGGIDSAVRRTTGDSDSAGCCRIEIDITGSCIKLRAGAHGDIQGVSTRIVALDGKVTGVSGDDAIFSDIGSEEVDAGAGGSDAAIDDKSIGSAGSEGKRAGGGDIAGQSNIVVVSEGEVIAGV